MIKTLDIEPTTICNLNCPFCFGPKVEKRETDIDLTIWKAALYKFKNLGVENIVISGGEPLLYKRIEELVAYLKLLKFNIVISTNCRFKEKLFAVANYCDWISLPIDCITPEMNYLMRNDNYPISEILATATKLKSIHSNLQIKIGTVATKINIHEIIEIGNLLANNQKHFATWKIYQYTPRRKHKKYKELLNITDNEFCELSNLIKETMPLEMKIVYSSNESRRNAYTFIYQNGDINLINLGDSYDDLLVGNIEEFEKINFQKVDEVLNTNHYLNFTNTY